MALSWGKTTLLLCTFGCLKEFRPSEPFITEYLTGNDKKFTKDQVNQEIYPIGTYANLSLLVLIFLITDAVRYKPMIIVEGLTGVITYCVLIWGHTLPAMQVVEVSYGLFMATEIAYYTYIYAMCDKKHYQIVSGFTRMGFLVGRFLSGVVSQITISFQLLSYHQLNYITLAGVGLSVPFAIFLPPAQHSLYFHRNGSEKDQESIPVSDLNFAEEGANPEQPTNQAEETETVTSGSSVEPHGSQAFPCAFNRIVQKSNGLGTMWKDFLTAYTDTYVVKWSLCWALATCGYLQVTSYIQSLWKETAGDDQNLYNGAVDAVYTLLGALAAWFVSHQKVNLQQRSSVILMIFCLLEGCGLVVCSVAHSIWVQYPLYVMFKILYHSMMTLASSEVAKTIAGDSHGLVFGFNTFIALALQTILTFTVAGKGGFQLKIQQQFLVYGCYFITLGVGFGISVCVSLWPVLGISTCS